METLLKKEIDELEKDALEKKALYNESRLKGASSDLKDVSVFKQMRKEIAQIKTAISMKRRSQ